MKAITDKLSDREAAMRQALLTQQQQLLPLLSPEPALDQQPELATAAETSATAPITLNPEVGVDLDLLEEMGH